MDYFSDISEFSDRYKGSVFVIGNFDGVHLGHQALLREAKDIAADLGVMWGVLTFEPHPRRLFRPDDPPGRITPAPMKSWRLSEYGANFTLALPFNWDLASLSAEGFVQDILIDALDVRHIVIGADFRFGQLRAGSADTISAHGIDVRSVAQVICDGDEVLSSSRIRQNLRHGKIDQANSMLGWDWELRGEIIRGDQRGRELGYPTANIMLGDTVHPAYGIYAAFVQTEGENIWRQAAVNIGIRPMFEIETAQVEAHILDFDGDIYGKILRMRPVQRLRGEAKFDGLDALIKQMDLDCAQAREILAESLL